MGRLTRRNKDRIFVECGIYGAIFTEDSHFYRAIDKLVHYEDMEEQGRLIELPCKVGDTVYYVNHLTGEINPFIIDCFEMNKFSKELLLSYAGNKKEKQYWKIRISIEHFEDRFCKTKEEAEAKLKELKGE